uniref:(northern house mosquito) hypothetical protein n=1 Tax=Culex pipiens TaxID=7175 RepID=A0A8D8I9U8_CULPI
MLACFRVKLSTCSIWFESHQNVTSCSCRRFSELIAASIFTVGVSLVVVSVSCESRKKSMISCSSSCGTESSHTQPKHFSRGQIRRRISLASGSGMLLSEKCDSFSSRKLTAIPFQATGGSNTMSLKPKLFKFGVWRSIPAIIGRLKWQCRR